MAGQASTRKIAWIRRREHPRLAGYRHKHLRDSTGDHVERVRGFVRQALGAAVESGEVREDIDIPAVTEMLIAVIWGMALYAGFVGTHDRLAEVVEQFSRLLAGGRW
ncbi:TetR family transcriptional regulator C-terminal domain-containing protein [Actinophytocola sediminis]